MSENYKNEPSQNTLLTITYMVVTEGRAYSRDLRQHSILTRKDTFYEKRALFFEKKGTANFTKTPQHTPHPPDQHPPIEFLF